jgi:NADH-quinone oxidoreductase subunit M
VQDAVHGPNRAAWHVADLSGRELVMLGVLAALLLGLGLYPRPVLTLSRASLRQVERANPAPARVIVDRGRP